MPPQSRQVHVHHGADRLSHLCSSRRLDSQPPLLEPTARFPTSWQLSERPSLIRDFRVWTERVAAMPGAKWALPLETYAWRLEAELLAHAADRTHQAFDNDTVLAVLPT
jgi:hypothetical protein